MEKFGDLIREAREHKGLSLREVGEAIGVHYANLSKMETNQRRPPPPEKVIPLAKVLGVDTNRLLVAAGYPVDLRYMHTHLAADDKISALDVVRVGPALSEGLELARKGEHDRALQIFRRLQQIGDLWEIYAALGTTFYQMRKYDEAELHLKLAIARVPPRPLPPWPDGHQPQALNPWPQARLYYDLALIYTNTGKLRLAEACILRAIELGATFRDLYYSQLCEIYTYQGRYGQIIRVAQRVMEEQRRKARHGLVAELGGSTDRARPEATYSLGYFDVCALAAYAHARLGQFEVAEKLVDGALALYNRYWYVHYVSAVVHCVWAERIFREWRRHCRSGGGAPHSTGNHKEQGTSRSVPPPDQLVALVQRARADFQMGMTLYPDFRAMAARDPDLRLLRKRAFSHFRDWGGYKKKGNRNDA